MSRTTFIAPTSKGQKRVHATIVARNLATHKPVDSAVRGRFVDLSQISSGKRVGRFLEQADAVAFAKAALKRAPELGTGEPLTERQMGVLSLLRQKHGGRQF